MVRTTPGHVLRKHIQNFVIESGRGEHQGRCRIASAGNAERWGLLEDAVDAVEFAASFLDGAEFEAGGICQARYAFALGYGGSIAAAEDDRRDGEVEFIHVMREQPIAPPPPRKPKYTYTPRSKPTQVIGID